MTTAERINEVRASVMDRLCATDECGKWPLNHGGRRDPDCPCARYNEAIRKEGE